jgi:hypothetical protein
MKLIITTILIFTLCVLNAPLTFACSGEIQSHRRDFREARAIFIGRAAKIIAKPRVPEGYASGEIDYTVRFEIERRWKGARGSEVTILVHSPVTCSKFNFQEGQRYLVYAFGRDLVSTTIFTRSRPIEREDEETHKDMRELNSFWFRAWSRIPFLK